VIIFSCARGVFIPVPSKTIVLLKGIGRTIISPGSPLAGILRVSSPAGEIPMS